MVVTSAQRPCVEWLVEPPVKPLGAAPQRAR